MNMLHNDIEYEQDNSMSSDHTTGLLLLFKPTTSVFRYDEIQNISSSFLHRDEIECGSRGLNSRKSPGQSATASPILGNAK